MVTSYEAVERLAILLESELEELVSTSWSTVGPKVKSVKGTPKGGKGGKDEKTEMIPREKVEKMEKEKTKEKSNHVISSQRPKTVATRVSNAQDIIEC